MSASKRISDLLKQIVSYYKDHGKKIKSMTGNVLKDKYNALNLSQVLKCQPIKKQEKECILHFIDEFIAFYIKNKSAATAKALAEDLKYEKPNISAFLKIIITDPVNPPLVAHHAQAAVYDEYASHCRVKEVSGIGHVNIGGHSDPVAQHQRDIELLQQKIREKDRQIQELSHRAHSGLIAQHQCDTDLLQHKLREKDTILREKDRQIQDLSHRLSTEMNTKVSANETSLENISVKSRPMNISVEYQQLFTDQWTEVKNTLDMAWKGAQEKDKLQYLCGIVLNAYNRCVAIKENCVYINAYIKDEKSNWKQAIASGEAGHTSVELKQAVFDYWKARGTKLEVPQNIVQQIIGEVTTDQKAPSGVTKQTNVQNYVRAMFCLTWSMVIQKPAMSLDVSGVGERWRGDKLQELAWGSKLPDQGTVQCYVYPTLKHGQQIMVRGKVLVL